EIQFSSTRSFRARRDHVPNRNCDCGHFGANKETQLLDGQSSLWHCRLRVSRNRFRSLTCVFLLLTLPCATPAWQLSMQTTEKRALFTLERFATRSRFARSLVSSPSAIG